MKDEQKKILFVEDSLADARMIQETLKDANTQFFVRHVRTMAEAVCALEKDVPDVIVVDLNLPDSRGLETCRRLQKKVPQLPLVVLTGVDDVEFATLAVKKGAQDYLVKGHVTASLLTRSLLYAIERKRAEERLRRLNEQLEQRVAERTVELTNLVVQLEHEISVRKHAERHKDDFVSMVSHELRTPLSIAKEGIDLMLDGVPGELNEKQQHVLAVAKRNIDRLARIINNLLDVSRIEAGKMDMHRERIDLCQLVNEIKDSFSERCRRKGLTLKVTPCRQPAYINADRDAVTEVLANLVGNAVKFTERGEIRLEVKNMKQFVQCTVADTGVGIAEDALPKVFDKFEQFHRDIGTGEKGTGLGLAISKDIVQWHGGSITVDSKPDQGTKFTFFLPKPPVSKSIKEKSGRGDYGGQ